MEDKPTHTIVLMPHDGSKRMFHTVTAKNTEEASIKARIYLAEKNISADIKMVVEHGDATAHCNATITFAADQIDTAAQEIMENAYGDDESTTNNEGE